MPGRLITRTWESDSSIYAPAGYKRACRYEAFVPEALQGMNLSIDATLVGLISEAEQAIRSLNEEAGPALGPLARLLLRTESIASSKIEGMQVGVRELARAEARVESGQKVATTALEVLANIDAMVLAVDDASTVRRFEVPHITAIHKRLLEAAPNKAIAGKIRTTQNWIGGNDYNPCGADFVPPPPEHVHELLEDLCASINDEIHSPLVQAALAHAQFETIHPFEDGNGRTGRAIIHAILRRRGVAPRFVPPISVAIAATKSRYIDGLTRFRGDEISRWLEYFANAALRAARLAKAYLKAVETLQADWEAKVVHLDAPRAGATVWEVLKILPAHPMVTVSVAAAASGRSKPSVYQAFEQLEKAGILLALSTGRRNQSWEVAGLLELIGGLESGQFPDQQTV